MKNNIIVTRRRYGFLRTLIIMALFSAEYFAIIGSGNESYTVNINFSYAGYIAAVFMFFISSHSRNVYLKYETELSVIFKCLFVDLVTGFFLSTIACSDIGQLWRDILFMMAMNLISIVAVFVIMNALTRIIHPNQTRRLHIYGREWADTVKNSSDSGAHNENEQWLADTSDIQQLRDEIDGFDEVYLRNVEKTKKDEILNYCFENDKIVYMTIESGDILVKSSGIAKDNDTPVYYSTNFGIGGISSAIKRFSDIIISLIGLILLSPFMAVIAIAIKLEDGGKVFYHQIRCTKDLKKFEIYKFRSMEEGSEKGKALLAKKGDERITRVGRIIRATKLDEIPQLVNVIKGDMSIVGPRPERPERIDEAMLENPEFILRTKVKAGITGYAQVHGYYNTGYKDKLAWDLLYIENFSILLDIKILIMTVLVIITGEVKE